jgi:hypothetical protein
LGYEPCSSAELAEGVEKVALYAKDGVVTHAARQLADGWWTSKLGSNIDMRHRLDAVEGPTYGRVVQCLARPRKA